MARRLPSLEALLASQIQKLDDLSDRLPRGLSHRVTLAERDLARKAAALRPNVLTTKLMQASERLSSQRLTAQLGSLKIEQGRNRLNQLTREMTLLHPERPLQKGYAMIERRDGQIVTSAKAARVAGALMLRFADGTVDAKVERGPSTAYGHAKPEQPKLF
jgi:exodeoxyribonuclease VII large subunit